MEEKGKKLGLLNLIGLCVGSGIGTGIFIMMGSGIAYGGRSIVLVCSVGCIYMLLAFWNSLAFGSMFVLPGGDYAARSMVFPPLLTGVSAWFQIASAFMLAGHSLAITQFVEQLWPQVSNFQMPCSVLVLTLGFVCTIRGSRVLTLIENLITVALIVSLGMFIVFGVPQVDAASFFSNADGGFWRDGFGGFMASLSMMSFACMGTSAMISMGGVTRNPKRTIPLASILATVVVAVVYALMGYVASGILPYEQVAGQNISVTAEAILPHGLYVFFVVGGGICAVASTMLGVMAYLRAPILRVAEDGWLPSVFTKTTKGGYPWVMYLVLYVVSLIPLVTGLDIEGVVGNTMIPTMILNIFMNLYCLRLPKLYPEQWEKRGLRFPKWVWNLCSVAGSVFGIMIIYNLFISLDFKAAALCVGEIVVMFIIPLITLKMKWVSPDVLAARKQETIERALVDTENEG